MDIEAQWKAIFLMISRARPSLTSAEEDRLRH